MKLSRPFPGKIAFIIFSMSSLTSASEPKISDKDFPQIQMGLTTAPLLSPVLAVAGLPPVSVVLNFVTPLFSQKALVELIEKKENDFTVRTRLINTSPHTKRFWFSGILAIGSLVSTSAYYLAHNNTYWWINFICSSTSAALNIVGNTEMFEEFDPNKQGKNSEGYISRIFSGKWFNGKNA